MTAEEIIAMAKDAGFPKGRRLSVEVQRLIQLAAAKEREACAQVCENFNPEHSKVNYYDRAMAEAIRARGAA
ncbi:hypothetical protein [Acidovorax sp. BL-A-41-H1]|uniref:hypothetical protein n=1 Tax=Acidovorax sp. BL-A-41-H1 TaxID=3421102 RepID=UPI003F7956DB